MLMNEALCKRIVAAFFRRWYAGEKPRALLRELLNEVYAQGVAAGQRGAK